MPLLENMQKETVSRLAIREPVTAKGAESLRTAIGRMREQKLGCAIAVDNEQRPVGILTEAMLTQLLSENPQVIDDQVDAHLSTPCPWVQRDDPIADVVAALELKNVRFLAVIDERGRLVGLTGQKGLMEYVADHFPEQVTVQRLGGGPFPHEREGA